MLRIGKGVASKPGLNTERLGMVVLAFNSLALEGQVDLCGFKASQGYIVSETCLKNFFFKYGKIRKWIVLCSPSP